MEQLCLIFPDQSNQLEFDFSERRKNQVLSVEQKNALMN